MDAIFVKAIGIVLAVGVAGFCSGARQALLALSKGGARAQSQGDNGSIANFEWWHQRRRAVDVVLTMGHRLALIAAILLALVILGPVADVEPAWLAAFVGGTAVAAVLVCDVVPATIAKSNPRRYASWAIAILRLPYFLVYPITVVLLWVRRAVVRLVGEPEQGGSAKDTARIWRRLLSEHDELTADRKQLLRSVVDFRTTTVREVMVPRTDMVVISRDMELDEILITLLECGHSRIPVHGDTLDDIVGLFYAKDIIQLMASGEEFEIREFLRRPHFVPETRAIAELLNEFQSQQIHLAVVIDEFGGVAGLITLEDIIEEFFGDIQDEYDVEPSQLVELSPSSVLADARIGIDEIEAFFGVEMPANDEYDSLGGFLLEQAGSVPSQGDVIQWEALEFRIRNADEKRIDTVEVVQMKGDDSDDAVQMVS